MLVASLQDDKGGWSWVGRKKNKRTNERGASRAFFVFWAGGGGELGPVNHIQDARRKLARWMVERRIGLAEGRVVETQRWELAGGAQAARIKPRRSGGRQGITPGTLAANNAGAKKQRQSKNPEQGAGKLSRTRAGTVGRGGSIRQNIIGHRMAVGGAGIRIGRIFRGGGGTAALLDQPAREHGGSVLLEPLVEEFANFLAEIGGVAQARKFVGLQGIARSREKKFPGSLGAELGHRVLPTDSETKYRENNNSKVTKEASSFPVTNLWKGVEKKENPLEMCSGCAGDYEDPDRSAWEEDDKEEVEEIKEIEEVKE